jgi:hypothetical protein
MGNPAASLEAIFDFICGPTWRRMIVMGKGHSSGRKSTQRGHKVLPAIPCEERERILELYKQTEEGPKRTRTFVQLDAHERKHGCGKKLVQKDTDLLY